MNPLPTTKITLCRCLACGEVAWSDYDLRMKGVTCPANDAEYREDPNATGDPQGHGPTQDVVYLPEADFQEYDPRPVRSELGMALQSMTDGYPKTARDCIRAALAELPDDPFLALIGEAA